MAKTFDLTNEEKAEMSQMIQDYMQQEHNANYGNLEAMLLLDFFTEKLAPLFYNKGVADSHQYMTNKLDDLFEIEKSVAR